ncbi:tetratricopeptide repeat-containing sensor histidine kinase [Maribacter sp. CXY002]|uniref:tetratricopeptide repeat-containing sensor histidine kinase n=1 Tax=Maribacter luteocoastalis TaxID=3407671 RepID=UPI003B675F2D
MHKKKSQKRYTYFLKTILTALFITYSVCSISQVDSIQKLKNRVISIKKDNLEFKKDTAYIDLVNKLSWELRYSELDSMLLLAEEAKDLSEQLHYNTGKINSVLNFSGYYLYTGKANKCIEMLNPILTNSYTKIDDLQLLEAYNQLGQAYFSKSEYPDSFKALKKALDIAEKLGDKEKQSRQNLNLGVMFSLLNNHKQAEIYFDNGLKIFNTYKNDKIEGQLASNFAYCLIKKDEWELALPKLEFSIEVFKKLKIPEWLAFSYNNMGDAYLAQEKFEIADLYFNKSLKIHNEIEDLKGRADALLGAAKSKLGIKNYDQANNLIDSSLELYNTMKIKTGQQKCFTLLYALYKQTNKPVLALKYLEKANALSNSIAKEENNINITMLNTRLEFEKEKSRIDSENNERIVKQRKYLQWFSVVLVISILVSFLIYKSKKTVNKLNRKLEEKTTILSENEFKLNQINKNQDILFSIVGHDLRGPIISLKELVKFTLENESGEKAYMKFAPKLYKDLEHIQFTLDNLLNWGQTQMKGAITQRITINIKTEVDTIINLFEKNIIQKNITVKNNLTENMIVYADLNHFNIIIRNLISNAIKFTPEYGKIWVQGFIEDKLLKIAIKDTGVGMSPEILKKIFSNYNHYSSIGTNMERGTGLGLQLCKEMIEKNSGTIYAASEEKQGSTFFVCFPLDI